MDPNNVNSSAVKHTIGEVLDTTQRLKTGDATADHGDVGGVESGFEFEVRRHIADPGFAGRYGPDAAEWLVLDVDTLNKLVS